MDEARAIQLSRFRVGADKPMGRDMTAEEAVLRKQFIKTMLRGVPAWKNLPESEIGNIRIYKSGTSWFIEDQDYYEYPF